MVNTTTALYEEARLARLGSLLFEVHDLERRIRFVEDGSFHGAVSFDLVFLGRADCGPDLLGRERQVHVGDAERGERVHHRVGDGRS